MNPDVEAIVNAVKKVKEEAEKDPIKALRLVRNTLELMRSAIRLNDKAMLDVAMFESQETLRIVEKHLP